MSNAIVGDEIVGDDVVSDEIVGDEIVGDDIVGDDIVCDEIVRNQSRCDSLALVQLFILYYYKALQMLINFVDVRPSAGSTYNHHAW